ncbi:phage regulatory protein/antirepressor Ant [Leucobacter musarum]|uniref:phage regulatory protein/antirepressor Ant n=1 Tax=Leucobacter musarum TaxID=1930747 RepID=UPI0006A7A1BE|nr:phage regulatory protein/antirepressor Ant [Leucobacter musarum]
MSEVQAINIVEDIEGELRVSSITVAERTDVQHKNVLGLVRRNLSQLSAFGGVAFQTRTFMTAGGPQMQEFALLNEPQSTLLMTFMRNSPIVIDFKVELVKQFYAMRQAFQAPPAAEIDRRGLALMVLAAEDAREAAEQKVAELEPRAGAWDDLASGDGDYSVGDAAKMLQRAGIVTGRDRLFEFMKSIGWVFRQSGRWQALQSAVDTGRLRHKPQSHRHPETGETVLDSPQVRITMKGIEQLRIRMLAPIPELAG